MRHDVEGSYEPLTCQSGIDTRVVSLSDLVQGRERFGIQVTEIVVEGVICLAG